LYCKDKLSSIVVLSAREMVLYNNHNNNNNNTHGEIVDSVCLIVGNFKVVIAVAFVYVISHEGNCPQ
jgi:hypothetical protein